MQPCDHSLDNLQEGMQVRDQGGDLGEQDLNSAKVQAIYRDSQGRVSSIDVAKGTLFHTTLEVPATRIEEVKADSADGNVKGYVLLRVPEKELEHLPSRGTTPLAEQPQPEHSNQMEHQMPTEQGIDTLERGPPLERPHRSFWHIIGPGLLCMSFTFVFAAFFTHPNWPTVLWHTAIPSISWNFSSISSAIALLGATISPYSMFWQTEGETEQPRSGPMMRQVREAKVDVGSGALSGQVVAYFIIITTASTLFVPSYLHQHGG